MECLEDPGLEDTENSVDEKTIQTGIVRWRIGEMILTPMMKRRKVHR